MSKDQAYSARGSVAKVIHSRLFQWPVYRSKVSLGTRTLSAAGDASRLFIGVLDIAGFEFFVHNSMEQLWVTLSNEMLKQFFSNTVFMSVLAEYKKEGIPITIIEFKDNQIILDLIEGKGGILPMLDDATLARGSPARSSRGRLLASTKSIAISLSPS